LDVKGAPRFPNFEENFCCAFSGLEIGLNRWPHIGVLIKRIEEVAHLLLARAGASAARHAFCMSWNWLLTMTRRADPVVAARREPRRTIFTLHKA
jgi:hypothetical protein